VSLVVGIDAGGTKLAAGLVRVPAGEIVSRQECASRRERGGLAVLADCVALAAAVAGNEPLAGVGLGVPELVGAGGVITTSDNWDWRGTDLATAFARLGPLRIESDVRAAALAEARVGAGRGLGSFVYLSIGTGVSHTFVIDGTPWPGARGNALVVGAPLVETQASGPRLAALAGKARAEDVLLSGTDHAAVDAVTELLAAELARLINALDPEAALIGGGLGLAPAFRERLIEKTRPLVYAERTRELSICAAALGRDAGIIGAALAAHQPGAAVAPSAKP
jgi:glucokinase